MQDTVCWHNRIYWMVDVLHILGECTITVPSQALKEMESLRWMPNSDRSVADRIRQVPRVASLEAHLGEASVVFKIKDRRVELNWMQELP